MCKQDIQKGYIQSWQLKSRRYVNNYVRKVPYMYASHYTAANKKHFIENIIQDTKLMSIIMSAQDVDYFSIILILYFVKLLK